MPDFEKVLNALLATLKLVFGENLPPSVRVWLGYILLGIFFLLALLVILTIISKLIDLFRDKFIPLFYNSEERRRSERRRRFAEHLESEIRQLNLREAWHDYRFTELEAEVEAEGRKRKKTWVPFLIRTQTGLRREKSLSRALETSEERLILLEGDPGSGKSVALRHVAQRMAGKAMKSRSKKSIIPIYINLKTMERRRNVSVDQNLIQEFVLQSLNRANDRDIEEFLEQEFTRGLQEGTWFFLFDSFDEIPEVLSSAEADDTVRNYGRAIESFLRGMNQCKGVIASRQFRGPNQLGWPRFNILPLTEKRREALVKKANLDSKLESKIIGHLDVADHEMRVWASNPMFLGLLCEHIKLGRPFPEHTHDILETYLKERLERDEEKLKRKFNLKAKDVRSAAEKIAFCMTAEANTGLNPARKDIFAATEKLGLSLGRNFDVLLDALEYLKLARSENNSSSGETKSFTFSHRRFQEYFATCVVLQEPDRVTPLELLTNARWRETTVVLCQTQPREVLQPIIDEAESLLVGMNQEVAGLIDEPDIYLNSWVKGDELARFPNRDSEPFKWPKNSVSLLDLLQDAFNKNVEVLTDSVRDAVGKLVFTATMTGILVDRKVALEVGGVAPQILIEWMLRLAFLDKSQWLKDFAYSQVAKLTTIPPDIERSIRTALIRLLNKNNPRREFRTARVHIVRLDKASQFLSINNVLSFTVSSRFLLLNYTATFAALVVTLFTMRDSGFFSLPGGLVWPFGFLIVFAFLTFPWVVRLTLRFEKVLESISLIFKISMILLVAYWEMVTFGNLSLLGHCIMAFFVYISFWPLTARWAASKGKFLHPLMWPVIPLIAVCLFPGSVFNKVRSSKQKAKEWVSGDWRPIIKVFNYVALRTTGLMLPIVAAFWLEDKGKVGQFVSTALVLSVSVIVVSVMIQIDLKMGQNRRRDKREWKAIIKKLHDQMTSEVFYDHLFSFKTTTYQTKFVEFIRINDLLIANKDSEELLTRIACWVEAEIRNPEDHRLGKEAFLDEISKLIEKVRLAQRNA